MDSSTLTLWKVHFLYKGCLVSLYYCLIEIAELNATSVDSDQTARSAASDLGLHCLPVSLLRDARLIWFKVTGYTW